MEQAAPQSPVKPMKFPGPDHPILIEHNAGRVVVSVAGRVIADTREALMLREAHYPAVQYIPREDVDMTLLARRRSESGSMPWHRGRRRRQCSTG